MLKGFVSGEEKDIVRIPMKGKNLFDYATQAQNTAAGKHTGTPNTQVYADGTFNTSSVANGWWVSDFIPVSGEYATVSNIGGVTPAICAYDLNKEYIRGVAYETGGASILGSATIDVHDAAYVRFTFVRSTMGPNVMLNLGSTALPYEPYGYQEGWEVRDNQDRLIWGREDELQTATGTLPFKGYTLPVKVKSLLGNAVQNGTPSPDSIIMPEMCGVRTANLFDREKFVFGKYIDASGNEATSSGSGIDALNHSDFIRVTPNTAYAVNVPKANPSSYPANNNAFCWFDSSKTLLYRDVFSAGTDEGTIAASYTAPAEAAYLVVNFRGTSVTTKYSMLNTGSTALPYEPFGWAEKITNAGQTVPVYLGEVPTVRRVRKLVLDGTETFIKQSSSSMNTLYSTIVQKNAVSRDNVICSHLPFSYNYSTEKSICFYSDLRNLFLNFRLDVMNAQPSGNTVAGLKEYLAAQYAAGHPVTVWYVLATEQTGIVNEPLCKIGNYADELSSTVATLPEIPTTTGQNTLTVDTTLAPSNLTVEVHAKKIHYGFKIDKSNDNSEDAVIYTHDAVTMTPAHMDFTNDRFDYGSWGNAFFVRDCYPVALNLDGTESYRLDPDDYTKKTDGTPSDIFYELLTAEPSDWSTQWKQYYTKDANDNYELNSQGSAPTFAQDTYYKLTYTSSFTGNFMMAFPKVWFYRYEDSQYNYIEVSNHRLSDDWKCYAHINANGQEVDFIYLPLFKGVIKDSKLRSLPGQIPQGYTTATTEVNAATALGSRWQIWDHSSVELINDLLILMSKSIDSQGKFGKGRESGYNSSDTVTYGKLQTGTLVKGGKFKGFSSSYKEVKVFGIEGFWANRWDRLQGMLLVNNVWQIKMTPPYNFTGTDFVTRSNASVPTGNGYLSKVQTSEYGSIPASIDGGSSTKYFKDYFYKTATDTRVAIRGGYCSLGAYCGFRYVDVTTTASNSNWRIGASPVYK